MEETNHADPATYKGIPGVAGREGHERLAKAMTRKPVTVLQIFPARDSKQHDLVDKCWCEPQVQVEGLLPDGSHSAETWIHRPVLPTATKEDMKALKIMKVSGVQD